jgi:hypothetical protein
MRSPIIAALTVILSASVAGAQNYEQCRHKADRSFDIDAASARMLELESGSGSVEVIGKAGLKRVVVRGTACASDADLLEDIRLDVKREGSSIVVRANVRDDDQHDMRWRNNEYARLDIVVEVPLGIAADINDGSGELTVSNLGAVRINDGSGEISASDVASLRIEDGSGEIRVSDVTGAVDIEDGSGEIELRNIGGNIDIEDGSGEIDIRVARQSIRISDSSGGIDVADVGGDFIVDNDGSGGIDYDNVRGRIDIPRKKR